MTLKAARRRSVCCGRLRSTQPATHSRTSKLKCWLRSSGQARQSVIEDQLVREGLCLLWIILLAPDGESTTQENRAGL